MTSNNYAQEIIEWSQILHSKFGAKKCHDRLSKSIRGGSQDDIVHIQKKVSHIIIFMVDEHRMIRLAVVETNTRDIDGGPSMGLVQEPQDMLGGVNFSSKVKEQVQALLTQLPILPGYSSMHKPGFVYLLEGHPEGVISCTHHPLEA